MVAAANIAESIGSLAEERRIDLPLTSWIEANPRADEENDRKYAEFVKDFDFIKPISHGQYFQIPAALRPPSTLSTAFGRILDEVTFRDRLETFTEEVGRTKEAEVYLVRWSAFMNAFLDKAFTVRALLEAARAADDPVFDMAAASEMGRMAKMMEGAPLAFQRNVESELGNSWAFDLVGMQLERMNQPMNMVGAYPHLVEKYKGEDLKQWRKTAINELGRLTDITTYLRGVESYKNYKSSLKIDLPAGGIDLFVAHPKQDKIDIDAVKANARSFYYLWVAMLEIALEAGRSRERTTRIKLAYSPTMGALLIKDKKPLFRGALYPFATEPPHSRLWSLVDRMGEGANLWMKGASFDLKGKSLMHTISQMVIQLPDTLVPNRKMTFEEARQQVVATKIDIGGNRVARVDETSEDSGVNPMAKVFAREEAKAQAEAAPTEFSGIVRNIGEPAEAAVCGADIFAEIANEVAMEEAAALKAQELAAHTTTGVCAAVAIRDVLLK